MPEHQFFLLDDNYEERQRRRNAMLFKVLVIGTGFILLFVVVSIIIANSSPNQLRPKILSNCSIDYRFDYYELALRWPVTICQHNQKDECPRYDKDWLIHGLWPTNFNGTWPQFCCFDAHFNIKGLAPIVQEMKKKWPNLMSHQSDDSLWRHEWSKHGTCTKISQLDYFNRTLQTYRHFPVKLWLDQQKISPSNNKTYTGESIVGALKSRLNTTVKLECLSQNKKKFLFQLFICLDKSLKLIDCNATSCGGDIFYPD